MHSHQISSSTAHPTLKDQLELHAENCVECGLCVRECGFLQKYGAPKSIATGYAPDSATDQRFHFECSLCGLCAAVCPPKIGLNPATMFLEMRREAVLRNAAPFPEHKGILGYEKRGASKQYSYYGLPENCDTIFFPGCTFPGTRPARLIQLFQHLQQSIPNLGIVLDCCAKPSHDLGREDYFHTRFGELREYLVTQNIKKVLTACPNCYKVFNLYGAPLVAQTVYEYLVEYPVATGQLQGRVTIHDPCSIRDNETTHGAVRKLIAATSLQLREMKHNGTDTICCGEGGSVGCLNRGLAKNWGDRRREEADGDFVVTYCAGCVHFLGSRMDTGHILDLLFDPEATLQKKVKIARAPFTYLNRLLLKRRFKKMLPATAQRERRFSHAI